MFRGIGVKHRGNVVFRMAGGEQHARHGKDVIDPLFPKPVEPCLDDRRREFKIAIFDWPVRE